MERCDSMDFKPFSSVINNYRIFQGRVWIMKFSVYDILLWIFFILSVLVFLLYVFGNSPTFEQALLVLIIGLLFKLHSDVSSNNAEINVLRRSFINLISDFKIIKEKMK